MEFKKNLESSDFREIGVSGTEGELHKELEEF